MTSQELAKYDAVLRRLCKPTGKQRKAAQVTVTQGVKDQWNKGGTPRKELLSILIDAAGDKDSLR